MLSVIIPAFNEEMLIEKAYGTISEILNKASIEHEFIFVDDGSKDATYEKIKHLAESEEGVYGINFSRNFGKESAISAGLANARGDCAVVIDCDLQHPPGKIVEMYSLWQQGYEIVEGVKTSRGAEKKMYGFAARTFYAILSSLVGFDMSNASDFKLLDRKVVDTLNSLPERNVFFRALSFWVGYKKATVYYSVRERTEGESKWSTKSLIKYAITNIGSFSSAPLHIVTVLGLIMLAVAIVFSIISLVQKLTGQALGGFTTVILLLLFSSSIIMISLGIVGYYIARIYDEIKGRPRYIISRICGREEEEGKKNG